MRRLCLNSEVQREPLQPWKIPESLDLRREFAKKPPHFFQLRIEVGHGRVTRSKIGPGSFVFSSLGSAVGSARLTFPKDRNRSQSTSGEEAINIKVNAGGSKNCAHGWSNSFKDIKPDSGAKPPAQEKKPLSLPAARLAQDYSSITTGASGIAARNAFP